MAQHCQKSMLVYVGGYCHRVGGCNYTVEIEESKFSQHNYCSGHTVRGQWAFCCVEQEWSSTLQITI
jgi:hypothetical protein